MVGVGGTLQYGVKNEYNVLIYDTTRARVRALIGDEKVAIGQLAAQYK